MVDNCCAVEGVLEELEPLDDELPEEEPVAGKPPDGSAAPPVEPRPPEAPDVDDPDVEDPREVVEVLEPEPPDDEPVSDVGFGLAPLIR
jgi:hypothetical protein